MKGVSEWEKKSDITTAAFPQWTPFSPTLPLPHSKYNGHYHELEYGMFSPQLLAILWKS